MISIIGAGAFSIVIILSILIICGLPLGELTMGGQFKVFPPQIKNRVSYTTYLTSVFCTNHFTNGRAYTIMVFV